MPRPRVEPSRDVLSLGHPDATAVDQDFIIHVTAEARSLVALWGGRWPSLHRSGDLWIPAAGCGSLFLTRLWPDYKFPIGKLSIFVFLMRKDLFLGERFVTSTRSSGPTGVAERHATQSFQMAPLNGAGRAGHRVLANRSADTRGECCDHDYRTRHSRRSIHEAGRARAGAARYRSELLSKPRNRPQSRRQGHIPHRDPRLPHPRRSHPTTSLPSAAAPLLWRKSYCSLQARRCAA